jgi:hypothetical protein
MKNEKGIYDNILHLGYKRLTYQFSKPQIFQNNAAILPL